MRWLSLSLLDRLVVGSTWTFFDETAIEQGLSTRDGQFNMALEIAEALRDSSNLMVEAGVGIGKSYAYLVPLLVLAGNMHKHVMIATSSIHLTEQIYQDVLQVAQYLGLSDNIRPVIGKGKSNYICENAVLKEASRSRQSPAGQSLDEIYEWIGSQSSGDRAYLPWNVDDNLWGRINAEHCIFDKCTYRHHCHFYRMRNDVSNHGRSNVIIVNQDLLIADALRRSKGQRPILRSNTAILVVDEAHNLEDKARNALTHSWTKVTVFGILRRIRRILSSAETFSDHEPFVDQLESYFEVQFDNAWVTLKDQLDNQGRYNASDRLHLKSGMFVTTSEFEVAYEEVATALDVLDTKSERELEELQGEWESLGDSILDLNRGEDSENVFWAQADLSVGVSSVVIHNVPKHLNQFLREYLFNVFPSRANVLTSATLCQPGDDVQAKYQYQATTLGFFGEFSEPKPSPFPYDLNTRLYIPDDILPPTVDRHEDYLNQLSTRIAELCQVTDGRTIVLFTSKEDLRYVHGQLGAMSLPWKLLHQQVGSAQRGVIAEFRSCKGILLGTGVFWEGINIQGPDLSQIIITRLPILVPDPIFEYKSSIVDNPLDEVYLPEMIVKLRQGVGRLIRHNEDRGIISILDTRLSTHSQHAKPYKSKVLQMLPIKNRVQSVEEARKFFQDVKL